MINDYFFFNPSTSSTAATPYLYIRKRSGNLAIFNAETSSLLNSFSVDNTASLVAWNFNESTNISAHILDADGNIYEIDGNYGRLNNLYTNPLSEVEAKNTPISSSPCISLLHKTYVTWTNNKVIQNTYIHTQTNKQTNTPFHDQEQPFFGLPTLFLILKNIPLLKNNKK